MHMPAIASRVPTCRTWQTILAATGGSESTVEVWAPTTKHQLHGITRANVLRLCAAHGIHHVEKDFSLTSVYSAEEAFVTGTFAGLIPVTQVRGIAKVSLREWVFCLCQTVHIAFAAQRHAPCAPEVAATSARAYYRLNFIFLYRSTGARLAPARAGRCAGSYSNCTQKRWMRKLTAGA